MAATLAPAPALHSSCSSAITFSPLLLWFSFSQVCQWIAQVQDVEPRKEFPAYPSNLPSPFSKGPIIDLVAALSTNQEPSLHFLHASNPQGWEYPSAQCQYPRGLTRTSPQTAHTSSSLPLLEHQFQPCAQLKPQFQFQWSWVLVSSIRIYLTTPHHDGLQAIHLSTPSRAAATIHFPEVRPSSFHPNPTKYSLCELQVLGRKLAKKQPTRLLQPSFCPPHLQFNARSTLTCLCLCPPPPPVDHVIGSQAALVQGRSTSSPQPTPYLSVRCQALRPSWPLYHPLCGWSLKLPCVHHPMWGYRILTHLPVPHRFVKWRLCKMKNEDFVKWRLCE